MTLNDLKAWIDINLTTNSARQNSAAVVRNVLKQVAEDAYNKVESVIGATALKTPITAYGTAKGLEIWGTNGTGFGLTNDYLEASIKTVNTGGASPEMEFWDVFAGTAFAWRDGAGRTERMRLKSGLLSVRPSGVAAVNADVGLIVGHLDGTSGIQLDSWADAGKQVYLKNWNGKFELVAKNGINLRTDGTYAEDINFLTGADVRVKITHNGNVIVGGLADNGLAKFQTPSISLGVDTWNYSSDGQPRFLFQNNGNSYFSTPANTYQLFRFGALESYLFGADNITQFSDNLSDFSQQKFGVTSAANRSWNHRKEASGTDYRFFDWNGSTARDWWNVYASSLRLTLGQVIHVSYGVNVGIGTPTPDTSAILDLKSNTKGLLLPQLTTTERNAVPVSAARKGLMIMNTTTNKINVYNGSAWEAVTSA